MIYEVIKLWSEYKDVVEVNLTGLTFIRSIFFNAIILRMVTLFNFRNFITVTAKRVVHRWFNPHVLSYTMCYLTRSPSFRQLPIGTDPNQILLGNQPNPQSTAQHRHGHTKKLVEQRNCKISTWLWVIAKSVSVCEITAGIPTPWCSQQCNIRHITTVRLISHDTYRLHVHYNNNNGCLNSNFHAS